MRKLVLTLHVVSAGAWIGVDVMVAVLVAVGMTAADPAAAGLAYQALGTYVVGPMLVSALVCLGTGLALGAFTRWGLVRYWWVAVKLVMNLALCAAILFALRPGMPEVAAYGAALSDGAAPAPEVVAQLVYPPAVSLAALTLATWIAVAKPWGRLRDRAGTTGPA
ncbi:hypothetical protein [Myceligenerans cantabricum]